MSLTETVGAAGLSVYAEAALVLFFAAFVAVAIRLTRKQCEGDLREQSALPFDGSEDEFVSATMRDRAEARSHGQ